MGQISNVGKLYTRAWQNPVKCRVLTRCKNEADLIVGVKRTIPRLIHVHVSASPIVALFAAELALQGCIASRLEK